MSRKFGYAIAASTFVLAAGLSAAAAGDLKIPDKAYNAVVARLPQNIVIPFIGIEGGANGSNARFDVVPGFDVSGVTGVAGFNGGVLVRPSEWNFRVGPRAGVLFGIGDNRISHPDASPFFDYKYSDEWTVYLEALAETDCEFCASERVRLMGSLGAAATHREFTATMPGFSISSSSTRTGVTASAGFAIPITPSFDFTGQFRYVNVPSATYNIPGAVQISGNQYIGTVGLNWRIGGRY
jgi:hypothetical protein